MTRLVGILISALVAGVGFGAATSLVNALSGSFANLESRAYTTSGWSVAEVVSVLLDSGWAWAGLAVAAGWLVTRAGESRLAALAQGAAAGVLALLAATAAYSIVDTIRSGGQFPWYESESVWWFASFIFGGPLGCVGACVRRPGAIGLLARLTVPVGAAVQMVMLPPGRNEVIAAIGKTVVWLAAAVSIGFVVVRFLLVERRRRSVTAAESP
ncbi:hypothetical protein [Nonomuraea sp. NPDC049784]|uniref:hypothetical protein n=1 Tax=Nonomuraea sp. NPDC049784 TaxID=3154361 RepID=UPI0033F3461A